MKLARSEQGQLEEMRCLLANVCRPNVLMVGPDAAVDSTLATLRGVCRLPIATNWAASSLVLPLSSLTNTLILRDVGSLPPEGQQHLMAWLDDAHGRTQTIATSADALWPRLQTGSFLARLYYRLNMIFLDLAENHPSNT